MHRRDHHPDRRGRGEVDDPRQVRAVIDEAFERHPVIQLAEVLTGLLDRLLHPLAYRDRGHHDHELGEAIAPVQLEDGAQVNIGLARPRLHFDGEVHAIVALTAALVALHLQRGRELHGVALLHDVQVLQHLFGQQVEAVGVAEQPLVVFQFARDLAGGDGEQRLPLLLSGEQVHNRVNRGLLVRKVGLEDELHGASHALDARDLGDAVAVTLAQDRGEIGLGGRTVVVRAEANILEVDCGLGRIELVQPIGHALP